jgi:hypothetical protein
VSGLGVGTVWAQTERVAMNNAAEAQRRRRCVNNERNCIVTSGEGKC